MIGHSEGQPRNNDVAQGVTRDVDPHPKTVCPEQHTPWSALEPLEHFRPGQARPLYEKIEITIEGPDGKTIRTLKAANLAGINRAWWDLRYPAINDVALRTAPAGNPHVWEEKRFVGKESRPVYYYGVGRSQSEAVMRSASGEPTIGPLVAPGTYIVKLVADGQTLMFPTRHQWRHYTKRKPH